MPHGFHAPLVCRVSSETYLMMFTIWIYTFLNIYLIKPCSSKAFFSHWYLVKNLFVSHCASLVLPTSKYIHIHIHTQTYIYIDYGKAIRVTHDELAADWDACVIQSNWILNLHRVYARLNVGRFSHILWHLLSRWVCTTFVMFLSMRVLCERILIVGN